MDLSPTKLDYYHDMWKLQSKATLLSFFKGEDGRNALILDSTIFHPQGGGQPADTGVITSAADSGFKFIVQDVRSKDGIVYHYGVIEGGSGKDFEMEVVKGREVLLFVDEVRRKLNSRLHSAGHLLDACMQDVGLGQLEPGKGYHFPDGPFVEYKGTIPQNELQSKQNELELAANALISRGGKVSAAVLPYEEAAEFDSTPRVVKLGNSAVCCGGTHVSDISEIISLQVSQIRKRKGVTKVSYTVGS
ncbi:ALANYL-TRNA EDITING PROTEIN [Salix koriyanagi]|uniref:ALANYL-TRNA EDITING PROTEIN n=1 Tax=Salix koriyanagi TaxID=2511006 RepID=A0A9Q1AH61_9ROSI|nr:ALANYL-TRNA EDITING PROTEIN [Salix koriyanagi]